MNCFVKCVVVLGALAWMTGTLWASQQDSHQQWRVRVNDQIVVEETPMQLAQYIVYRPRVRSFYGPYPSAYYYPYYEGPSRYRTYYYGSPWRYQYYGAPRRGYYYYNF